MNKAVFLDRDGVINNPRKNYYVYKIEDFKLNPGVIESLKVLQEKDYMLIVISNQGGISKGKYTIEDVDRVHEHMENILSEYGVDLSAVYFCPHHPKKENCLCRKPHALMLEKAMARFDIDPRRSFFIGDRRTDVQAGEFAGLTTIKIRKNGDLRKVISQIS